MITDHHILIGVSKEASIVNALLGPFDGDETWHCFEQADWSDVAVAIGLFSSRSQARKNNWFGEIPRGFSERRNIGKQRLNVFIIKGEL